MSTTKTVAPPYRRRAKIVATMGPSALAPGVLEELVAVGIDCARLNFSHGSHEQHQKTAERIRAASMAQGRPVAILADLQGPKIRVGVFKDGPIQLVPGEEFILTSEKCTCDEKRACVSYEYLEEDLKVGDPILLDDGLLGLRVKNIDGKNVICTVETGGPLSDRKGVNLPGTKLRVSAMTEKDKEDVIFAVNELHVDYVAISFVRTAADVQEVKKLAGNTPVIAKLEKPEAIANLEEIMDACDGAMVARGDLGVEIGSEKVPMIQKRIIQEANRRGKVVITATQMLDSMIRNPRPTRAEAADVANAILDGTDAVMLSGETASGAYPIQSVKMMDAVAREAELSMLGDRRHQHIISAWELENAAARGAANLSYSLQLDAIVVLTRSGRSADLMAAFRPNCELIAYTPSHEVAQRLALQWGVRPQVGPEQEQISEAHEMASRILTERGHEKGAPYSLVLAIPKEAGTNSVVMRRVGE